jgi:hypothetical protein
MVKNGGIRVNYRNGHSPMVKTIITSVILTFNPAGASLLATIASSLKWQQIEDRLLRAIRPQAVLIRFSAGGEPQFRL